MVHFINTVLNEIIPGHKLILIQNGDYAQLVKGELKPFYMKNIIDPLTDQSENLEDLQI